MSSFIITGSSAEIRLHQASKMAEPNSQGIDLQIAEDIKGIAQIKELSKSLSTKPYQSKRVSLIITEAGNLTPEAQNAFLKTLEESPGQSDIYLLTSTLEKLLPTIRSRCQIIDLGPVEESVSQEDLTKAWDLYVDGRLSDFFEASANARPEVWGELARQILLFQLDGEKLVTASSRHPLTKIVDVGVLEKISAEISRDALLNFLTLSGQISQDITKNVNRRLAMENLFLTLPRPKGAIIK